ncbi:MAG: SDR family oxidoreductase [Alphaproteobacteria bacterium]|nr:SDR family oxidoreductase [Alphaproteobacteria bacterium]
MPLMARNCRGRPDRPCPVDGPMTSLLITGANRGIGFALTTLLAARGWTIHATCRNPGTAQGLQKLTGAHRGQVVVHALDVSDFAAIDRLGRDLRDQPIDVLLNNAGIMNSSQRPFDRGENSQDFDHTDDEEWMQVFRINTMAPLKMAETFVDHVARGDRKVIATVSSIMGSITRNESGGWYPYRTSKTAANMLMRNLAADLRPRGIACLALHPGWVRTEMGGPKAAISVDECAGGLATLLERASMAETGKYIAWNGEELPW